MPPGVLPSGLMPPGLMPPGVLPSGLMPPGTGVVSLPGVGVVSVPVDGLVSSVLLGPGVVVELSCCVGDVGDVSAPLGLLPSAGAASGVVPPVTA